ncbi:similar to Saccharomyces cerevisiae YBR282W MRPL27 Mitochondrial ribosomal protein of the large subunit [Maudiozyma barnettii]|uniref:Similar to Saccharomyces cerevisiae YBR282W MRPL27 Mitochondrial ribosomal protein of the large subunit n=1 Tax=Maudiozyma barnettii TaxID=61262 RepID=A0A8H2VFH4_9SACH|nr:mitochondrial 54S ribosomal protein YmL27 [Kazachstania barnettii]CAB4254562.1 similar to Saccharomyces cerevisiae YBR282W MRPL27 Mitochondrial ribosomal protein of the large subunit [Kazachstania barnettii]CAD1782604.1 similar to Saccharomyces cerevisiae YBR282W MRPL27 Mitochondrial ribosomal protein of the large subunit [Kazachstania barnettii]
MKPTSVRYFSQTAVEQLTRPWKKYRDGTLFYGLSKSGNRRTPLTTKQGNKTMYKGTRSSGIGKHTKFGEYVINWTKVRTYVTPKYLNMDLKPLLSSNLPELKHEFKGYSKGPQDTKLYIQKLKDFIMNGRVQSEASDVNCYVERG